MVFTKQLPKCKIYLGATVRGKKIPELSYDIRAPWAKLSSLLLPIFEKVY